ncbi:MAG: L,D-transpeptidase [Sorangiineae bacterium]|nr:L,D-transpeptidase [Polyangiaceae bacterium]MEB2324433.1 L,D-transpeptidase [Sorangiineae bacterium]
MSVRAFLLRLGAPLCGAALVSCPAAERSMSAAPAPAAAVARIAPVAPPPSDASRPEGARAREPEPSAAESGEGPRSSASEGARAVEPEREPTPLLGAVAKETWVYSGPSFGRTKVGYLRAGALVQRGEKPEGFAGCAGGWYRIAPYGYVCVGKNATLELDQPVLRATRTRADRDAPLPYVYGQSRFPTPPYYTRVPSAAEQAAAEPELARSPHAAGAGGWREVPVEPLPDFLEGGRPTPWFSMSTHSPASPTAGRAMVKSAFSFLAFFDAGGRRFGLTADLDLLPMDRLKPVVASSFHGLALEGELTLPVVFVRTRGAWLYDGDPRTRGLTQSRPLAYREAVPVTGVSARVGSSRYLETREGKWLLDDGLVRIDPMKRRPGWATPGRSWLDISILRQSLVAYEGTRPVYVTLVSTGVDGLGDPEKTHSTVRGQFLVHTKHVSVTMDGDEVGDEFDLRDVPYVQYFHDGYALHAAYWHDGFGQPRSHGCVNLAPIDARWLFAWSSPPVPAAWHGALSLREGTLVSIHP